MGEIKVLIVDDSAFMRYVLSKQLNAVPGIRVVGTACNGVDALDQVMALHPDVVTMDVTMPRMDGLQALQRLMARQPTPVVMVSNLTQRGAATTVQALTLGAVDFVAKPPHATRIRQVTEELIEKIRVAAGARVRALNGRAKQRVYPLSSVPPKPFQAGQKVLIIGSSTGGPRALRQLLVDLPGDLPAAVLIVQHMPPHFTRSLADSLNRLCALEVREAASDDCLQVGLALVAPGGYHLAVRRAAKIRLSTAPPLHGVRPAVDITMETAADVYKSAVIGVVLTGMGYDGTRGACRIKQAGGTVIAEDESTSVVYGMPRSVVEAGVADQVVPLDQMAAAIVRALEKE